MYNADYIIIIWALRNLKKVASNIENIICKPVTDDTAPLECL